MLEFTPLFMASPSVGGSRVAILSVLGTRVRRPGFCTLRWAVRMLRQACTSTPGARRGQADRGAELSLVAVELSIDVVVDPHPATGAFGDAGIRQLLSSHPGQRPEI